MNKSYFPLLLIGLLFVAFRVVSTLVPDFPANSAPIAALFFCGAILSGRGGVLISAILFLASYPILSLLQGYPVGTDFLVSLVGFSAIAVLGLKFHGNASNSGMKRASLLIGGSLACAIGFYFFANTLSWLSGSFYEKSWNGFYQAQWGQHPTLAQPTWVFFRNSLVANASFALVMAVANFKLDFRSQVAKITA